MNNRLDLYRDVSGFIVGAMLAYACFPGKLVNKGKGQKPKLPVGADDKGDEVEVEIEDKPEAPPKVRKDKPFKLPVITDPTYYSRLTELLSSRHTYISNIATYASDGYVLLRHGANTFYMLTPVFTVLTGLFPNHFNVPQPFSANFLRTVGDRFHQATGRDIQVETNLNDLRNLNRGDIQQNERTILNDLVRAESELQRLEQLKNAGKDLHTRDFDKEAIKKLADSKANTEINIRKDLLKKLISTLGALNQNNDELFLAFDKPKPAAPFFANIVGKGDSSVFHLGVEPQLEENNSNDPNYTRQLSEGRAGFTNEISQSEVVEKEEGSDEIKITRVGDLGIKKIQENRSTEVSETIKIIIRYRTRIDSIQIIINDLTAIEASIAERASKAKGEESEDSKEIRDQLLKARQYFIKAYDALYAKLKAAIKKLRTYEGLRLSEEERKKYSEIINDWDGYINKQTGKFVSGRKTRLSGTYNEYADLYKKYKAILKSRKETFIPKLEDYAVVENLVSVVSPQYIHFETIQPQILAKSKERATMIKSIKKLIKEF